MPEFFIQQLLKDRELKQQTKKEKQKRMSLRTKKIIDNILKETRHPIIETEENKSERYYKRPHRPRCGGRIGQRKYAEMLRKLGIEKIRGDEAEEPLTRKQKALLNAGFDKNGRKLNEDSVPVNNVGDGNIHGIGVGEKGEPGIKKKKKLKNIIKR